MYRIDTRDSVTGLKECLNIIDGIGRELVQIVVKQDKFIIITKERDKVVY